MVKITSKGKPQKQPAKMVKVKLVQTIEVPADRFYQYDNDTDTEIAATDAKSAMACLEHTSEAMFGGSDSAAVSALHEWIEMYAGDWEIEITDVRPT